MSAFFRWRQPVLEERSRRRWEWDRWDVLKATAHSALICYLCTVGWACGRAPHTWLHLWVDLSDPARVVSENQTLLSSLLLSSIWKQEWHPAPPCQTLVFTGALRRTAIHSSGEGEQLPSCGAMVVCGFVFFLIKKCPRMCQLLTRPVIVSEGRCRPIENVALMQLYLKDT